MNKATFKALDDLKNKPFYNEIRKNKINSYIEENNNLKINESDEDLVARAELEADSEIEKYVSKEIDAFYSIYLHRCLTYKQLYKMHFLKTFNSVQDFETIIIKNWITLGIVKKIYFKHNNYVLFLTTRGVDIVANEYDFDANILDDKKRVIKRGYFRANELEMHPRLINHQIYLNQFVINFKRYCDLTDKKYNTNLLSKFKYFDEKHMSKYKKIRPDGLISLYDIDFFLEMDMSTESRAQLIDKWNNYRGFLTSNDFSNSEAENKIIVLFIIENSKDLNSRKDMVLQTTSQILLDKFDSQYFDIYIGSSNELLNIVFNDILPSYEDRSSMKNSLLNIFSKEDFMISHGYNVKHRFENIEYDYYIRKLNQDGTLQTVNNTPIEFLISDYRNKPLSTINKASYHKRNSLLFKATFKREIPLIIIYDDIKELYKDLTLVDFDFDNNEKVYFADSNTLDNDYLYESLYQIDNLGNVFKFNDYSLRNKEFNYNIYNN